MTGDVRELLPLYALGILDADEAGAVERAVASDAALAAELASYLQTAHAIGSAIQPVAPSPEVKDRLMASVGGGRFEAFAARMARMYDVTVERGRELLGLIERAASWIPQVVPGLDFVDFEGGPATAGADCGFVRLAPGAVFPPHTHLGEEIGVFEAVHGSAPDIAGKGIANPTALLFSALLMLRHIGEGAMADRIMKAVVATLSDGVRTRDLGGTATTVEYADAICQRL